MLYMQCAQLTQAIIGQMSFLQCLGLFFVVMLPALDLHFILRLPVFYLQSSWSVYGPTLLRHCGMSWISLSPRRVSVSIYNRHESPPKPRNTPTKFEGITIFLIIVGVIQCTFFVRMPNTNNRPAPNLPTGSDIQGRASVEPPANPCKARPTRVLPQGL